MDPYEKLANAIIIQAAKDYRHALQCHGQKRKYEQFFRSRWFGILTRLDGERLMKRIKEEYE